MTLGDLLKRISPEAFNAVPEKDRNKMILLTFDGGWSNIDGRVRVDECTIAITPETETLFD